LILNTIGAGIVLIGGIIGFLKAKSSASLIASSIFSTALFLVNMQIDIHFFQNDKNFWVLTETGIWAVLGLVMFMRTMKKDFRVIPANVVAVLSIVLVFYNLMNFENFSSSKAYKNREY